MKRNIFKTAVFIAVVLAFGCKKDNNFKEITDKVYTINKIERGGCFDSNSTGSTSTAINMYLEDELVNVEFGANYDCLAKDSIDLKGNVLSIFIKPGEENNSPCNCNYEWKIKLNIIKNKGLKLLYFAYENGKYVKKAEMYNHKINKIN